MTGRFLTEVKGWTPVIDALAEELGLIPAVVYGVAWRFCQMKDGVCSASLETIAKRVGISRATARRHIKALCVAGYLEDLTPEMLHRPHRYRDTGKAQIIGLVTAKVGESESATSEPVGVSERPTGCITETHPGGSERPTNRLSKETQEESNTVPERAQLFRMIAKAGVIVNSHKAELYATLLEDFDLELIRLAFAEARTHNLIPRWQWVRSVLTRCKEENCKPGEWPDKPSAPELPGPAYAHDGPLKTVWGEDHEGNPVELTM